MSSTSIQLNGSDLESKLHLHFGTISPDPEIVNNEDVQYFAFSGDKGEVKGYIYEPDGYNKKKFWVYEENGKVIVTTTLMAHGSLTQKGSYQTNFTQNDIDNIIKKLQLDYLGKQIYFIIPRVETSLFEDHIVIEYRDIKQDINLIIDSKPAPSGFLHSDVAHRIHTEKQKILNTQDCGFHVCQTIPVLHQMIAENIEINVENIVNNLPDESALSLVQHKLQKLEIEYSRRVVNRNFYHKTFCFFEFGFSAEIKLQAVRQMLKNIEEKNPIFAHLNDIQKDAAQQGTLGSTVKEYLDASESFNQMSIKI
ncbi:MAG: hypothetical protein H0U57_09450 [Tatlockia sp.]|nr:hypothetical protein [Tatlockia sp.]